MNVSSIKFKETDNLKLLIQKYIDVSKNKQFGLFYVKIFIQLQDFKILIFYILLFSQYHYENILIKLKKKS